MKFLLDENFPKAQGIKSSIFAEPATRELKIPKCSEKPRTTLPFCSPPTGISSIPSRIDSTVTAESS